MTIVDLGQLKKVKAASRRFPPPWSLDETNTSCFVVRDALDFAARLKASPPSTPWCSDYSLPSKTKINSITIMIPSPPPP